MNKFLGNLLDNLSDYLAQRRGMLPLVGVLLIIINFVLQIVPGESWWIVSSNLFLHLGLVVGLIGILLIRPLE